MYSFILFYFILSYFYIPDDDLIQIETGRIIKLHNTQG